MRKIVYIVLFLIFIASCVGDDEPRMDPQEYVEIGDSVPDFIVSDYHSETTIGKITLITFFDPLCGDCRRERPVLQYVWDNFGEDPDFEMVNIARGYTLENLASTDGGEDWMTMPYYPDPDRKIYNLFATSTIPRIYLIDREGIVRRMWVTKIGMSKGEFLKTIKSLVETP